MTDEEKKLITLPFFPFGEMTFYQFAELFNNMVDELEAYKKLGTVNELELIKHKNYMRTQNFDYSDGYKKGIDDLLKQVRFEEKWLFDTGLRSQDVNIAFNGIYVEAKRLKM